MPENLRREPRAQTRRLIAQVAIATNTTMDQVREMSLLDFQMLLQELTGKRQMTDSEIAQEVARWRSR